ncbi:hypothetical protein Mx9_p31 [Myxococcus phage Mx9]|nr:hypothetical protein Mx9_p31 [Myxococcus phage Mx9]
MTCAASSLRDLLDAARPALGPEAAEYQRLVQECETSLTLAREQAARADVSLDMTPDDADDWHNRNVWAGQSRIVVAEAQVACERLAVELRRHAHRARQQAQQSTTRI